MECTPPLEDFLTLYNPKIFKEIKDKGHIEDMIQLHFVLVTYIKLLEKALKIMNSVKNANNNDDKIEWWVDMNKKALENNPNNWTSNKIS